MSAENSARYFLRAEDPAETHMQSQETRRGVILFNLGGPETLADVRPFLYRLFSDPDIIRIRSNILRNSLAWFIAATRQYKSRDLYRQIGGGSPLRRITEGQAKALQERLTTRGLPARVYVGMRCWNPTIDEAVSRILRDQITKLVVLPLFPQFSVTTTGSCFGYFRSVAEKTGLALSAQISYVDSWYAEPLYIQAMAELIQEAACGFAVASPEKIQLLYSAHSIPARYVREGDPYLEQTRKTVALINGLMGNVSPSTLAFQSKIGPVRWLEPSTKKVIEEFGRAGNGQVLAIPDQLCVGSHRNAAGDRHPIQAIGRGGRNQGIPQGSIAEPLSEIHRCPGQRGTCLLLKNGEGERRQAPWASIVRCQPPPQQFVDLFLRAAGLKPMLMWRTTPPLSITTCMGMALLRYACPTLPSRSSRTVECSPSL